MTEKINRLEKYDKISIAKAWIDNGGRFLKHLGEALMHADPINARKIVDVFSNYVDNYEEIIGEIEVRDNI